MSTETFSDYNNPWRVKPGKTIIFLPHHTFPLMGQLAAFKTPVREIGILSNFRIFITKDDYTITYHKCLERHSKCVRVGGTYVKKIPPIFFFITLRFL